MIATKPCASTNLPGGAHPGRRLSWTIGLGAAGLLLALACSMVATLGSAPPAAGSASAGGGLAPQSLFEETLRRYGAFRDFRAHFTETPISRAAGEGTGESGVVSFKRPGLWRWDYLAPEKKLVIVRETLATIQVAGEKDVTRYEVGEGAQGTGLGALLEGGEAASRLFVATLGPSENNDEFALRLDPVTIRDEFDHVVLRVRRKDFMIREVLVEDPGGNKLRFEFDRFEPNPGLPERLFTQPDVPSPPPS